jgi:phage regulator Rha-like protein
MNTEIIHNKIYEIRGHKVMLDYEIAEMFEVETRTLNQAVKRNIERFPEDFMFQLTENEWGMMRSQIATSSGSSALRSQNMTLNEDILISQFVTSKANSSQIVMSSNKNRGKSYRPYAFTEHGVTMLASVLRSEKAVKVSIAVVRAFISLKQYIADRKNISKQINSIKDELSERIDEQDVQIIEIYQVLDKLIQEKEEQKPVERNPIGFKSTRKKHLKIKSQNSNNLAFKKLTFI